MKKNSFYVYIAAYLALLIPTTGRFVYGITLMLELIILTLIGTLINSLIKKLKLTEIHSVLLMLTLIASTILFRQVLVITYSEIALTLGFIIYLPPVSVFLINTLMTNNEKTLLDNLKTNSVRTLLFCLFGIVIFLARDIAGYGTFTFFGKNHHIYEKVLLNSDQIGIFSFFATIPGTLSFTGILLYIHVIISKKFKILKNAEEQQ